MRTYLAGPMYGLPDHNRAAFDAAAKRLRKQGHFVINPAELSAMFGTAEELADSFKIMYYAKDCYHSEELGVDVVPVRTRQAVAHSVMDADLAAVRSCDAIYLLRGWESSRGAKRELSEAIAHGLAIIQEGEEDGK